MLEKKLQDAEYEAMKRQLKEEEEVLTDVVAESKTDEAVTKAPTAQASSPPPPLTEAELKKIEEAKQIEEARAKAAQLRGAMLCGG